MMSVFLPKTSFAMKGNLSRQENRWLGWWQSIGLYALQREHHKGRSLFILHDGPPYANGAIHLGHALNYILKDFVNRWKFMQGQDVSFIPGWDCHGLPIEAKIEEEYRDKGQFNKGLQSIVEFRSACRQFAKHWIEVQKKDFQRLGVLGDWDHPYATMDFAFESRILHHLFRLVRNGYIYRGVRPVWWSADERTALAEAEIEYKNITSKAIYVRFPLTKFPSSEFAHASVIIWTTTPWSLPGNRAICYGTCIEYIIYEIKAVTKDSLMREGEKIILAKARLDEFCKQVGITEGRVLHAFSGSAFQGALAAHPWAKEGYNFEVPLLPSEYAQEESGTGLVHTAPSHGTEDFIIGQRYQLDVDSPISEEGKFFEQVPLVGGLAMEKSYEVIRQALVRCNALAGEFDYVHSYPHSWRSKKPLFCRTTPQWFIALDGPGQLRKKALEAIKTVTWYPESAQTRIETMVTSRPDWCISRQRVWGVPIAEFLHKQTGQIMNDPHVHRRIEEKAAQEGTDFWFTEEAWSVLEGLYDKEQWVKSEDIIDVWFESGVTHEVILKDKILSDAMGPISWPASLYLEGSDQHRGWFQSSLLTSVALEDGQAPYQAVLTHGFLLDEKGYKMSKSLGNVISPQQIVESKGADILRLWVAYEDYQKDLRAGPSIFERVEDIYRRLRNTLRYALGALNGFSDKEWVDLRDLPLLEKWLHHRLFDMHLSLTADLQEYNFRGFINRLHLFCSQDLSSFYFDICKDSLYCDSESSFHRQAIRTSFFHLIYLLIHWLAPILCFTAEEAWACFGKDILDIDPEQFFSHHVPLVDRMQWVPTPYWSIHLNHWPSVPELWKHERENYVVDQLRELRSAVTGSLEKARERKEVTTSLQTAPVVYLGPSFHDKEGLEILADICLTSSVEIIKCQEVPSSFQTAYPDIGVEIKSAEGNKCERCWRTLPEVVHDLCQRCQDVVSKQVS